MFATDGSNVCKGCFYTADANARTSSGATQLIWGGVSGIVLGVLVFPLAFVSVRLAGIVMAVCIGGGITALRQGLAVRARQRLG